MYKSFSMELAGRTLTVDVGRVAKQANGAAFMHYGDTVVLSTATASEKPRDGIDFFPLSVEYEEKMYAVGKIPGGFNKREGKASEHAILTSRVIDRPMRPLFPKDYRNDVTLNNMVMSVDPECDPEVVAMLGSAIATCISDIPFDGPCAMTQIGMIDGEFIVNPTLAQKAVSDLKLTVASTREKVIMIEAGAKEIPEAKMIDAIYKAHEVNQEIIKFIDSIVAEVGKPKHAYESCAIPEELFAAIKEIVPPAEMEEAVFSDDKQTREENIRVITEKLEEAFADNEEWLAVLGEAVYQYQKKTVRKMILKDHKRPDGRAIDQIRPLAAEVDLIPRVHGSAMFTRGQTQRGETFHAVTLCAGQAAHAVFGHGARRAHQLRRRDRVHGRRHHRVLVREQVLRVLYAHGRLRRHDRQPVSQAGVPYPAPVGERPEFPDRRERPGRGHRLLVPERAHAECLRLLRLPRPLDEADVAARGLRRRDRAHGVLAHVPRRAHAAGCRRVVRPRACAGVCALPALSGH